MIAKTRQVLGLLNILIVEDSLEEALLLAAQLESAGFDLRWRRVETEAEYVSCLQPDLDIILSDLVLRQFSATRALALLRESKLDIPFVIVSGTVSEEHAVESIRAGATDYVLKNQLHRVETAVQRALAEFRQRAACRQLEAHLIEAQKLEIVGHLASGVAHDFNNVLSVIILYADLMLMKIGSDHPLQEDVQQIQSAVERATALTRQLLLFSRKEEINPVVLDLNEALKGIYKMLERLVSANGNIELAIVPGENIGSIKADPVHLGQLLINLVVNARDAMISGGKVTIETQNVLLDENDPTTSGNYVMLSCADTGTGMTDEVRAHLLDAFSTKKTKDIGTGWGLATCQTIVRQCGAHISVESEVGKGSTFKVYFPRIEPKIVGRQAACR